MNVVTVQPLNNYYLTASDYIRQSVKRSGTNFLSSSKFNGSIKILCSWTFFDFVFRGKPREFSRFFRTQECKMVCYIQVLSLLFVGTLFNRFSKLKQTYLRL